MAKMGRPKTNNPKKKEISVFLDDDVFIKFDEKCKKIKVEKSPLIRKWIIEFLENEKK